MGGKSSPDYSGAAVAQGEANREVVRDQTFANRPDQYTPWGATTWTPYQTSDPATGEATTAWSQTQSLTPELQDILNKQVAIQSGRSDVAGALTGRMGAEFTKPMDWRGLNPMGEVPTQQYTIPEEIQRGLDYSDIPLPSNLSQQTGISTMGMADINSPEQVKSFENSDLQTISSPEQQTSLSTFGLAGINGPKQQTSLSTSGLAGINGPKQQTNIDYSGINNVGNGVNYRSRAEQAIYDKGASRLGGQFENKREQMEIKLRNQGLRPGDAAYQAQVQSIDDQETDAYGQLQNDAIMAGMAEANQAFNQDVTRRGMYTGERDRQAQFSNDANANLFNMQSGLRGQLFGERDRQGQFSNDANANLFNMQSGRRSQLFGERESQGQFNNQAQQNVFNMESALNNQQFAQDQARAQFENDANSNMFNMESGLRNQLYGERESQSQLYNDARRNLYSMEADRRNMYTGERDRAAAFYNQAGQQAYNQAQGANAQNFQQAMAGSQYANQLRQQQITEAMTKRGFSLNEINALLSGQQVNTPQMPSFQGASAAQAAPVYQAAVDQGNYNAGMSPWNALIGAGGSVVGAAGSAGGFSQLFS